MACMPVRFQVGDEVSKSRKRRKKTTSGLKQHRHLGKQLVPPMMSLPKLRLTVWNRDVLPDMIWICSHVTFNPLDKAISSVYPALELLQKFVSDGEHRVVDGTLTGFEIIPKEKRADALRELAEKGLYEKAVPKTFAHALGLYPEAPGIWIIDGHRTADLHIDPEVGEKHLWATVLNCFHGQSEGSTFAKMFFLAQMMREGKIKFAKGTETDFLLLTRPWDSLTDEEKAIASTMSRAAFGSFFPANEERWKEQVEWAKTFWRKNFSLFPCREWPNVEPSRSVTFADLEDRAKAFIADADRISDEFLRAASATDPDVYFPDRYEVLVGLASRGIRLARLLGVHPLAWTPEIGTPILRAVLEGLIVARWLIRKNDAALYTKFKDYGRGHLKLQKLHMEDILEGGETGVAEEDVDAISKEVNEDLWEEFQIIDLSGTFAGKNTRQMAIEVDMKKDYDLVFSPASAQSHGEWAALDRFHLSRCANPLHRFHRLPKVDLPDFVDPKSAEMVLEYARMGAVDVLEHLGPSAPDGLK
jgi:uncharacterized protein DUF5677